MGFMSKSDEDLVHLARLLVEGKHDDVTALLRRALRRVLRQSPELATASKHVLGSLAGGGVARMTAEPLRPVPVDGESRLPLVREELPLSPEFEPVWPVDVRDALESLLRERAHEDELVAAGIAPTRTVLFVGPPGVGKTLAARWVAWRLQHRLLTLDLAAVMSSLLGRTGGNIRNVLNYARQEPAVLLLDEFDAVAKKRADEGDVGELKRLVNVLLQAIDDWPATGLLIAATNHPELLDPAVWRRFELVIEFPLPSRDDLERLAGQRLGAEHKTTLPALVSALVEGGSFADLAKLLVQARRMAVLDKLALEDAVFEVCGRAVRTRNPKLRLDVALRLVRAGRSQRQASSLTGVSRDTIRRHLEMPGVRGDANGR